MSMTFREGCQSIDCFSGLRKSITQVLALLNLARGAVFVLCRYLTYDSVVDELGVKDDGEVDGEDDD